MADDKCEIEPAFFGPEGYLPPGMHRWNVASIAFHFVEQVPESTTRPQIWAGFHELRECLTLLGLTAEQWIDGSFTTTRADPNDIDVANFFDPDQIDALEEQQLKLLKAYVSGHITRRMCRCDSYFAIKVPEEHPLRDAFETAQAYWAETFGTDRNDSPKGIVVTQCEPPSPPPAAQNDESAADTP